MVGMIEPMPTTSRPPLRQILLLLAWYSAGFHRGIARYAHEAGWVLDSMVAHQAEFRPIWQPDGVICTLGVNPAVDGLVKQLGVPFVNIGHITNPSFPQVGSDNRVLAKMAVEHFSTRGFRHFLYYFKGLFGPCEVERRDAFQDAVAACHGTLHLVDASHVVGKRKRLFAMPMFKVLRRSLVKLPKPLAALGYIDDVAVEIITACRAEAIRIPEQVAVLGVGNDELVCNFAPIPLSSIDENHETMGYTAAKLLDAQFNGRRAPHQSIAVAPSRVMTRQSSEILAVENVHVAQVLKNIWTRYCEPISAEQVAADVPMSYRRLQDVFVECVGHSIFEEILRRRLDYAVKLLVETNHKLTTIAAAAGFSSVDHFGRAFKRKRGMTPGAFRKMRR